MTKGNNSRRSALLALAIVPCVFLSCAQLGKYKETAIGAGGGAVVGAGVGGALGGETGAIVGGLAGIALGAVAGQMIAYHDLSRTEAMQKTKTDFGDGKDVLQIVSISVTPPLVRPGQSIKIDTTYIALKPSEGGASIKQVSEVLYNDKVVSQDPKQKELEIQQGGSTLPWEYSVPATAPPGRYVVLTKISMGSQTEKAAAIFTVSPVTDPSPPTQKKH